MSNAITENNGQSAIRGLENVVIHNTEEPKSAVTEKKISKKSGKDSQKKNGFVKSLSIQEEYVEKQAVWLRYEDHEISYLKDQGDQKVVIGYMTTEGVLRNTTVKGSKETSDLIKLANKKWSPVSKVEAEQKKNDAMNKSRAILYANFG